MCDKVYAIVQKMIKQKMKEENIAPQQIVDALKEIRKAHSIYRNPSIVSVLDFTDCTYKCAYMYYYFVCRSYCVRTILHLIWEKNYCVKNWLQMFLDDNRGRVKVCSLGGGPGIDISGVITFLEELGVDFRMWSIILDHENNWRSEGQIIKRFLFPSTDHEMLFPIYNFFKVPFDEDVVECLRDAAVLTIVNFISEMMTDREFCINRLVHIFRKLKPLTLILFIDYNEGGYFELMNMAGITAALRLIYKIENVNITTPAIKVKGFKVAHLFNILPQQSITVSASLWLSF